MQKIPKIKSIGTKILGIVFICAFLISAALGYLSFNSSKRRLVSMLGESIKGIAATTANFINANDVSSIIEGAEKLRGRYSLAGARYYSDDEALIKGLNIYRQYTELLSSIKKMNKIDGPINVYSKEGERLELVLTSDRAILVGAKYNIRPEARSAISQEVPQSTSIYTDKDGTWISAYASIPSKKKAVVEVNYRVDSYIVKLRHELFVILLTCIAALVATAFVGYNLVARIVSNIKRLDEIARTLEREEYDVSIEIGSKDEVGHLAETFDKLRSSIKRKMSELRLSLAREKQAHLESIIALTNAMGLKDPEIRKHLYRVEQYALLIGRAMHLGQHDIEKLRYGCYLHDIGKLGIDAELLQKVKLSKDDFEQVKRHSEKGAEVIEGIEFLQEARDIILYHQEHYDGTGYPKGLKGNQIPLLARVVAVADAFDAMTTDRPYKPRIGFKEAMDRIEKDSGRQFDPEVCEALLKYRATIEDIAKKHFKEVDKDTQG